MDSALESVEKKFFQSVKNDQKMNKDHLLGPKEAPKNIF